MELRTVKKQKIIQVDNLENDESNIELIEITDNESTIEENNESMIEENNESIIANKNDNKVKYILTPEKIPNFINIDILKKYVAKDIDGNKEYFDDRKITYKISDPKKAEWILNKSLQNSKLIGDGNNNSDIKIGDDILIDVSVLTLNKTYTNEKSLMQKFNNCNDLDSLFTEGKGEKAVEIFKKSFSEKFDKDKTKKYII